jgi:hypothetical protein
MEFNPPIESRETDELIVISKSSTDEYQARAIELAKKELNNRRLSQKDIDSRYMELFEEAIKYIEKTMIEKALEDYTIFEKIQMIVFWPFELFHGWFLKRNGYDLKAKNRIKLIFIGVTLYALLILFS